MDGEDLIICLVLYIGLALRLYVILGCFALVAITPQEQRSACACAVQTRFRLSRFCTHVEKIHLFTAPEPFFKRPSLASPSSLENVIRSSLCGPNTFPPVPCGIVFDAFLLKCIGLLCIGPTLLRPSHAWPFSSRKAIRLCLCGPNP